MRSILLIILLSALIISSGIPQAYSSGYDNEAQISAHNKLSCLDCHSYIRQDADHSAVETSDASCLECHENSYGFHQNSRYEVNCLNCHSHHREKISHDAHSNVPCKACHLHDIKPIKETKNNLSEWSLEQDGAGEDYDPHRLIIEKQNICSRCHYPGNNLGASDTVLPAKSIICMPCHAAIISLGDTPSVISVIIFLIGLMSLLIIWMSAGKGHGRDEGVKSIHLISVFGILFYDVLFQRRLLKISIKRWFIHAMIFFPFLIRFIWGILALAMSWGNIEWSVTWAMLDKNNPVTGLVFDITGISILSGGLLMFVSKLADRKKHNIKGLPAKDILSQILLTGIILTGFILEGARISMTGTPQGSQYAFLGYIISRALVNYHLNGIYTYLWHIHAVITAGFIACLPFGRMFHVILTPLSIGLKSKSKD